MNVRKFEKKYPYCWLLAGLVLTLLSYGIFNTTICAWIFAIPLIRYINIRTKWSSIIFMLIGLIIVANITFWGLVEDGFNIKNQLFCTFNGIRMWAPFFVYFLCRFFKTNINIGYYAFPATVAAVEFFIDNPFVSVMTSLSVSQFWNIGLMQVASVTGVVGVTFLVTAFASIVNFIWERGIRKSTVINAISYGLTLVLIISIGMARIEKITTTDKTIRIATSVEDTHFLAENEKTIASEYQGDAVDKLIGASVDVVSTRAADAVYNEATLLTFPEDAFVCPESRADDFIEQVKSIAKESKINILLPLLRIPETEGVKKKNTLNFISNKGELLKTYLKNHLVPVVEEPFTEKGDGETPVVEVDGIKYTFLICADYTSNKYAYNGREADILLNPSYDWKAFQYFTSYGLQARAIECGFSALRNPVNGNIVLYDSYGRPLHMSNAMNVHSGMIYLDVPKEGHQTIYGQTGNWFPWICAGYAVLAVVSSVFFRKREIAAEEEAKKQL